MLVRVCVYVCVCVCVTESSPPSFPLHLSMPSSRLQGQTFKIQMPIQFDTKSMLNLASRNLVCHLPNIYK